MPSASRSSSGASSGRFRKRSSRPSCDSDGTARSCHGDARRDAHGHRALAPLESPPPSTDTSVVNYDDFKALFISALRESGLPTIGVITPSSTAHEAPRESGSTPAAGEVLFAGRVLRRIRSCLVIESNPSGWKEESGRTSADRHPSNHDDASSTSRTTRSTSSSPSTRPPTSTTTGRRVTSATFREGCPRRSPRGTARRRAPSPRSPRASGPPHRSARTERP